MIKMIRIAKYSAEETHVRVQESDRTGRNTMHEFKGSPGDIKELLMFLAANDRYPDVMELAAWPKPPVG